MIAFVLAIFAHFNCTAAHGAYNHEHGFLIAADLLNKGMYLESIGMYREIAENAEDPNQRARALLFIGTTYSLYLEQYQEAISIYQQVLTNFASSPSASDALFNTGMIQYEQAEYELAYQTFTRYLQSYPRGMRSQSAAVWADSAQSMSREKKTTPPPKPTPPEKISIPDTTVRVLIASRQPEIAVQSSSTLHITEPFSGKEIFHGNGPLSFSIQTNQLVINGRPMNIKKCRLTSPAPFMTIGRKNYRGSFSILAENSGISIINQVEIEKYLYGVIPKEMPASWNPHALRAQAVAARTYALYIKSKSSDKAYDVEATTASQVYGGYDGEKTETNAAVDATRGQVMTYNNRLIVAYFHANSGGYTEDPSNVWKAALPYLKSVPDKYSENIPKGEWQFFLSYKTAARMLKQSGLRLDTIRHITAKGHSQSGRALMIELDANSGPTTLSANNFRIKIGGTQLKSTLFNIHPDKGGVLFKGKGYGHGVGMSQWGADKMAKSGFAYQEILKYYYRDIKIMNISS